MNVLVLNCGSSTVKFRLFATGGDGGERCLARGLVERIGGHALLSFDTGEGETATRERRADAVRDHRAAVDEILRWLLEAEASPVQSLADIHAVGHRVVHGGERFRAPVRIDPSVVAGIEDCIELAPLHNPANVRGIRAAGELLGAGVPQVAVFDTAFHASMPEACYLYGIPYPLYRRHKIRRYGFHGSSHQYLAERYAALTGTAPDGVDIITLHLGNGCSACAIRGGRSFDTSMGFTPLQGLVMGTRSGDIDPSLVDFLVHKEGMSLAEVDALLNKHSGLLGISGLTADMRELLEEEAENGDRRARLAVDIFCLRVKHYVGAYLAEMGGADAIVWSGGIGENAAEVRRRACEGLGWLGVDVDLAANERLHGGAEGEFSAPGARVRSWVVPTNEELLIAREALRLLAAESGAAPQAASSSSPGSSE